MISKKDIMIVEDEAIVADDLSRKLETLGYSISAVVSTGRQAVTEAHALQPQLVLMDIQLAGEIDGIEAAQQIKNCCGLPVIFLTAHSDAATLARAKLTEPFGYILKPFEERDLATQIEMALAKHQVEQRLHEQREWLQVTLSSIGDAVIATSIDQRITFINPVAQSLTGWNAAEVMGAPVSQVLRLVDEQSGQPVDMLFNQSALWEKTSSLPKHVALLTKDGRKIPVEDSASPINDSSGKTIGMVYTFQDVTESRAAEQALQHSEYLLNKAQEMAHLGCWEHHVDTDEIKWSDEVFRIFGLQPGEKVPTFEMFLAMVHPDDRHLFKETYRLSLSGGGSSDIEHRLIRPDGEVRYVREKWEHIRDGNDRVVRSIGVTHDITLQKQAQEALERSNRELEQFAYVASHDLQEPLRAIIGFLQLLQSRYSAEIDEKGRHFIERSVKAGHRMQSLIKELLNLSRISSRGANFVMTDLNTLVQEVVDSLHSLMQKKHSIIICETLPTLPVDVSQIRSLLQNLMVNGMNYNTSDTPTIEIGCQKKGRDYHFFVKDNGIGIDARFHQRIFVVFQRLHTEAEFHGTGMGLAMCKKIVERHGGRIWVESTPGKGSTFYFTLPDSR